jgi:hypothetical protein
MSSEFPFKDYICAAQFIIILPELYTILRAFSLLIMQLGKKFFIGLQMGQEKNLSI